MLQLKMLALICVLTPLLGSIIAGIFGKQIGKKGANLATIAMMTISFIAAAVIFYQLMFADVQPFYGDIYTWGVSGSFIFSMGFMIDKLTSVMMVIVTFVSLMVHVYSIGYMSDDEGYQRFFCYMSLFTFAMLMLVTANNFLQLFFGWEGVGLVSYLLIGFWFNKDSANLGSIKAFIVNRIGDLGFILAIAALLDFTGSLDYKTIFAIAPTMADQSITLFSHSYSLVSVVCILLFIGAMGKSAQMPLHIWLPESMEGPTPISALIHAATMVTAGVFMVARMSPIFEYSQAVLSMMLVIGGTTALFTGLIAIVQNDIKRVVAYSTLSQLGYMVVALGASAFSAAIFHLVTHAFFKALLFLAAGSVIIAMHHEQDMRKMGGLRKYIPWTYTTFLIGALALCAIPPFAGFYSKDMIIDSVRLTQIPGAHYAYICVLFGAFVTSLYTFRAFFLTFHTHERFDESVRKHIKESPKVMVIPLLLLSIPSVLGGAVLIQSMLFNPNGMLSGGIFVLPQYDVLARIAAEFPGVGGMILHAVTSPVLWLSLAGIFVAWFTYILKPAIPAFLAKRLPLVYNILMNKYGFDNFNETVFVKGTQSLAKTLFHISDEKLIDDGMINGSGRLINFFSGVLRKFQTGHLYQYSMVMVLALVIFLWWLLV